MSLYWGYTVTEAHDKIACCCPDGGNEKNPRQSTQLEDARQPRQGGEPARGGEAGKRRCGEAGRRGGGEARGREGATASKQAGERTAGENRIIACRENTSHATATEQLRGEHVTVPTDQSKH